MSVNYVLAICNVIMVVIWFSYLYLIHSGYKKQNRPFIIIHHAQSNDPDSHCMIVNMSKEPLHIQCINVYIYSGDQKNTFYLNEYLHGGAKAGEEGLHLREGPVQPGGYLILGTFRDILLGRKSDEDSEDRLYKSLKSLDSFELCVAAIHGPTKSSIGARRRFYIESEAAQPQIRAHSIHTEQLVSWRKRKIVRRWVEERLQPKEDGSQQTQDTRQTQKPDST